MGFCFTLSFNINTVEYEKMGIDVDGSVRKDNGKVISKP